ncbi:anoctamin-10 [Diretmus argenteus]
MSKIGGAGDDTDQAWKAPEEMRLQTILRFDGGADNDMDQPVNVPEDQVWNAPEQMMLQTTLSFDGGAGNDMDQPVNVPEDQVWNAPEQMMLQTTLRFDGGADIDMDQPVNVPEDQVWNAPEQMMLQTTLRFDGGAGNDMDQPVNVPEGQLLTKLSVGGGAGEDTDQPVKVPEGQLLTKLSVGGGAGEDTDQPVKVPEGQLLTKLSVGGGAGEDTDQPVKVPEGQLLTKLSVGGGAGEDTFQPVKVPEGLLLTKLSVGGGAGDDTDQPVKVPEGLLLTKLSVGGGTGDDTDQPVKVPEDQLLTKLSVGGGSGDNTFQPVKVPEGLLLTKLSVGAGAGDDMDQPVKVPEGLLLTKLSVGGGAGDDTDQPVKVPEGLLLTKLDVGGGAGDDAGQVVKAPKGKLLSDASGWTKVSCPCCVSENVEPLVLVQLGEKVHPETKTWLIKLIGAPTKDGGAALLAHPGEDSGDNIIVISAPRCTLFQTTEELGLCKPLKNRELASFSYHNRDSFKNSDNIQEFLTLAERQYIVKHELDSLRAQRDLRIPGLPDSFALQKRDNIWLRLQKAGVIVDMFPLHNHEQLDNLSKAWWSGHQVIQPLDKIHAYFGSPVAFYFSFIDFFTWALLPPAILSLAITFFSGGVKQEVVDSVSELKGAISGSDSLSMSTHIIMAIFSILWSTVFIELWKRQRASLSCEWGTLRLAEHFTEPRPEFCGELGVNPVTNRIEPLFPEWRRQLRMVLVSIPVVGLFLGLVYLGIFAFYWGEDQVKLLKQDSLLSQAMVFLPSLGHVTYTNVLALVFPRVALRLTEYENHREESVHQNHLTAKVLVFTFFNFFAVLFHIAFVMQDLPLLHKRLSSLLVVTQVVNQMSEVVIPFLVDRFFRHPNKKEKEDDPQEDKLKSQQELPPFPGLFREYIELLVQFGYLSLFSSVFPLTAVLLLINNLTEIRSDAYKICRLYRKPFSAPAAGIGVWQPAFEFLSFVSVISNCWLLLLSAEIRSYGQNWGVNGQDLLLFAVVAEHLLIVCKMVLAFLIPDEPDWVIKKRETIEFASMQALAHQDL